MLASPAEGIELAADGLGYRRSRKLSRGDENSYGVTKTGGALHGARPSVRSCPLLASPVLVKGTIYDRGNTKKYD